MTRIVATVGPACSSEAGLTDLLKAGVDQFRFTASKTPVARLIPLAETVRRLAGDLGREVELLIDLPGAKTRLTNDDYLDLAGVTELVLSFDGRPGQPAGPTPTLGVDGRDARDPLPGIGDIVVVGDGEDALRVVAVGLDSCTVTPLTRGVLGIRRGVQFPGATRAGGFTGYDLDGLRAVAGGPFDAVIISFAESAGQVEQARALLRQSAAVIAKIETGAGARAAAEIAGAADGILLGRGDLLLDTGVIEFYAAYRRVLDAAHAAGCPVLVGTQLLTSLAAGWLPHRSELAHVSALIEEGVAGLMLAEETAGADDPVRAVALLDDLRGVYAPAATRTPLFARRR
ncbi:pyruvate kinase [Actinoplanes sp. L3-i22]|uniref:pyruvate kinase n=1 Tax=Actinoplanes sp. L3-i22 TaxID=2836373 RepID=UPI001C77FAAB|nr:pyruvate kinase [Actinoplanes sp. L3-i22]BCY09817.1 hypothetical protein L3i22_049050 [Actinoplanes sp. L3-i22]